MDIEDIPSFTMTGEIINDLFELEDAKKKCGNLKGRKMSIILRKTSMIQSVNSSLMIEGSNLKPYEVRDVLNGKDVIGPFDEIVEARNALKAYGRIDEYDTWSVQSFLEAHDDMMFGLVPYEGFRTEAVGIFDGDRLIYSAPDHSLVAPMMERLFDWCAVSDLPAPIIGAIAHYYIETIHPFVDGNGRMGRLWNSKVLYADDDLYRLVPMETFIHRRQSEYYAVLESCQRDGGDCGRFVRFCIRCLIDALEDASHIDDERMIRLLDAMGDSPMPLRDVMAAMGYSNRTKFMDSYMKPAIRYGFVSPTESSSRSRYQRYRKLVRCRDRDRAFLQRSGGEGQVHHHPGIDEDIPEQKKQDDSIIIIMLAILVVMVVILAIVTILRMMRS